MGKFSQRSVSWGESGVLQTGGKNKEQVTKMEEDQIEVRTGPDPP